MERAYCLTRIDVSMDDVVRAMEAINYPILTCCAAADQCNRASLEVSVTMIIKKTNVVKCNKKRVRD